MGGARPPFPARRFWSKERPRAGRPPLRRPQGRAVARPFFVRSAGRSSMAKSPPADHDSLVRSVLTERGDSGRAPRHTLFFFYDGDLKGLSRAAKAAGYQVSPTAGRDGLVLETMTAGDEERLAVRARRMDDWGEADGGELDR